MVGAVGSPTNVCVASKRNVHSGWRCQSSSCHAGYSSSWKQGPEVMGCLCLSTFESLGSAWAWSAIGSRSQQGAKRHLKTVLWARFPRPRSFHMEMHVPAELILLWRPWERGILGERRREADMMVAKARDDMKRRRCIYSPRRHCVASRRPDLRQERITGRFGAQRHHLVPRVLAGAPRESRGRGVAASPRFLDTRSRLVSEALLPLRTSESPASCKLDSVSQALQCLNDGTQNACVVASSGSASGMAIDLHEHRSHRLGRDLTDLAVLLTGPLGPENPRCADIPIRTSCLFVCECV